MSASDPDDDRTVIRVPPRAGAEGHTLPPGTRLEGLEITGLVGEGGFGIVYTAWDPQLERTVAVKEYMPSSLAARAPGSWQVTIRSERHRDTFAAGLKSFVNEARLLAQFDHPALVKVFRFWQAHQTAYMAMPYYEGPTLKAALAQLGGPPPEALLRDWLRPLLDALALMHRARCYHRDIAPDNILLTDRGPLLLDFGAARRVIGDMTQALTVVLKPGYAPIEQYGESSTMQQGPWTDLYAVGSVLHYAITGRAPTSAVERMMGDTLRPLAEVAAGRYREAFLRGIDRALALRPQDRPQDVQALCELLDEDLPEDSPERLIGHGATASGFGASGFGLSGFGPSGFGHSGFDVPLTGPRSGPVSAAGRMRTTTSVPRTGSVASGVTLTPTPEPTTTASVPPRSGPPGLVWAGLGVCAVAVLGAVLWWQTTSAPDAPSEPPPAAAADTAPAPTAAAPVTAAASALPPIPAPAPPAPVAPPAEPPAAMTAAPPPAPATPRSTPAVRAEAEPPAPRTVRASPANAEPAPVSARVNPARCSDILQKASLQSLDAEETDFLRRECR